MKYLRLLLSNLKRRKLRTALTVLSILVAFMLFGYLAAVRVAFSAGVEVAGVDRLIVRHKVSLIRLLPEAYKDRMQKIEGVDLAAHSTWFGGVYQKPTNFFAQLPVEPEPFLDMYPEYLLTDEERRAWLFDAQRQALGDGLANAVTDHVVHQFADGAGADVAGVKNLVAKGVEHGFNAVEDRLLAAYHDRQVARRRAGLAAANWGVEHVRAFGAKLGLNLTDERRPASG